MRVVVPAETHPGERRVALVPAGVALLKSWGFDIDLASTAANGAGFTRSEYEDAGASLSEDVNARLDDADIVLRVRSPSSASIASLPSGTVHVSLLDPFRSPELVQAFADRQVSAISLELIPRISRAQKMDVLSSQASLAGYAAVVTAAHEIPKVFPMMMTPAGTLPPARVLVVGAGVAGLQAIATARRLGARVEAFDTRPAVAEEVRSLGARFLEIDIGESGQTDQGYAKALTDAQLALQREGLAQAVRRSDVVITTAQVFGRPAPRIVTEEMTEGMKPGSIVIDMAVETGGNVAGSVDGEARELHGVKVLGLGNLPSEVAAHASEMFSANLVNFIGEFSAKEAPLELPESDPIIDACLVTRRGDITRDFLNQR